MNEEKPAVVNEPVSGQYLAPDIHEPVESSPETSKSRRFARGLKLVLPFKRQSGTFDGTSGSKPDVRENGHEIRNRRRKLSFPEVGVHRVFSRTSSGVSIGDYGTAPSVETFYSSHSGSTALAYQNGSGPPPDPVAISLRVMVCLSSNRECLPTLISYICLPRCISKLVVEATWLPWSSCRLPRVFKHLILQSESWMVTDTRDHLYTNQCAST